MLFNTTPFPPEAISASANQVVSRLQEHGYQAFIVGGCIRDLLCRFHPEDYDISTNATPPEIKKLFRRAYDIGARFPIVHIKESGAQFEVTTFRGRDVDEESADDSASDADANLHFGHCMRADARRRDFTINAIYYDPTSHRLYDFHNGMNDLRRRRVRVIGDASKRYLEDPVRMLRALRLVAHLDFRLDSKDAETIRDQRERLSAIPPARLAYELRKLFRNDHARRSWRTLLRHDMHLTLFPSLRRSAADPKTMPLIDAAMQATPMNSANANFYAALLWPAIAQQMPHRHLSKNPPDAFLDVCRQTLDEQRSRVGIAQHMQFRIMQIWEMQWRLDKHFKKTGARARRVVEHRAFNAAMKFLLLREQCGWCDEGPGRWWRQQRKPRRGA